ncbi:MULTISPECIES: xanthine dehydrogenase family protein molybdopterin-binding subunit [unclassified Burkholderia]|uniref:xanthine dehydrogenase family protein molybdopterin-binding subunit n=1 Tax=unclassified Burkholderia TaxID=2613784 RepID=UPI0016258A80|nr:MULTISPECIES: molybdopterin cofactor-binding domain-containing protein [unclassified Burkholderia]
MTMNLHRREFLIRASVVAGSFVLGVARSSNADALASPRPWDDPAPPAGAEFTPWIVVGRDNVVTVRVATPDIGNGVMTQALMTVTEELHCDWNQLIGEYASPHRNYVENNVYAQGMGYNGFFARSTLPRRMELLLQAGASARERLKEAAARTWNVPRSEIDAKDSILIHGRTGRRLTYGDVAKLAGSISLDTEPAPKPQRDWWFLGKASPARVQQPLIAHGTAVYGIDVKLPGMVHAALIQAPVHGGKLVRYDFEKVRTMPGVLGVAVVDPSEPRDAIDPDRVPFPIALSAPQSGIAVIAEHYWQARKALEAMPVEWSDGPGAQWKTHEQITAACRGAVQRAGDRILLKRGNAAEVLASSGTIVEAEYHAPFAEHAAMEPLNGTALVTAERVDVWHPSQQAQQAHIVAAQEAGLSPDKVYFHQTYVGGGFGRRGTGNDVRMVVAVAKRYPGRPVKVIWSREETMRQGRYRSIESVRLRAALDADGMPVAFHAHAAGAPEFFTNYLHDGPLSAGIVDHVLVESSTVPLHVLTGSYRGPGYNAHATFIETFVDECAHAAGIDPLAYRLKLYSRWPDPAWVRCLTEVADKAHWGRALPKGWGQGIAIANYGMNGKPEAGTTVAAIVTVEVTRDGDVRVESVDIAFDPGHVGYPDGLVSQMEGGSIFALNSALNEQITVANGKVVESNFHNYPMMRIGDAPKRISVHFGGVSGHPRMAWVGESPMGPVAAALGNALFTATGKRLRSMPYRLHDLSWT